MQGHSERKKKYPTWETPLSRPVLGLSFCVCLCSLSGTCVWYVCVEVCVCVAMPEKLQARIIALANEAIARLPGS